jgi:SanA protein
VRAWWRRWRWRVLIGVVLFAVSITAGSAFVVSQSRPFLAASVEAAPVRPYVIVLGNRVFPGGIPSPELGARLKTALALYRAGRAARVVVSGLARPDYDEPSVMQAWLVARGVPVEAIVVDLGGHRTAATMANAASVGVRSALIATQDYHLPRALYLARRAGIDAMGVAAPRTGNDLYRTLRVGLREAAARTETLVEVALRGVKP